jgi:hypothetical protein
MELLQLGSAAYKASESTPDGRLEASPRRARSCHFIDLHCVGQPFHRHWPERLYLDVTLDKRQRSARDHKGR